MNRHQYIIIFILIYSFFVELEPVLADDNYTQKTCRIFFYNTENFFDTFDDPNTNDNEFLPNSERHWTYQRYLQKVNNIYKVIISLDIQPPAIIGLSEIENDHVLVDLTQKTPLLKYSYRFIHKDSPDPRGIDVALLYRPELYHPIKNTFIQINFPFDKRHRTRDILYTKGIILNTDTIHIFVNHWPSRYGGQSKSFPFRNIVAQVLRQKIDSIFKSSSKSKIIIVGDFNDNPDDISITKVLNTSPIASNINNTTLYNLSYSWLKTIDKIGTIKYKGEWSIFDQIIISGTLLNEGSHSLYYKKSTAKIDDDSFLLEDDEKYGGREPFRTYNGLKYMGGFSDHLPVYFDLIEVK